MNSSLHSRPSRLRLSLWLATLCATPAVIAPRLVHADTPSEATAAPLQTASTSASTALPASAVLPPRSVRLSLLAGRTLALTVPADATWKVERGQHVVSVVLQDGELHLSPLGSGEALVRVRTGNDTKYYALRVPVSSSLPVAAPDDAPVAAPLLAQSLVPSVDPRPYVQPQTSVLAQIGETIPEGVGVPPLTQPKPPRTVPSPTPSGGVPATGGVIPGNVSPLPPISRSNGTEGSIPVQVPPTVTNPVPGNPITVPPTDDIGETPRISPSVPFPTRPSSGRAPFATQGKLPASVAQSGAAKNVIPVTQGLARLLTFPSNILAVFFSDTTVMDARAINARTVAVTGTAIGESTLAVFTARYPGDAVGRANIFRIGVQEGTKTQANNPTDLEASISGAIGDPRVHVTVIRSPRGNAVVRLSGTVRDANEVEAAKALAGLYVPPEQIISSISVASSAPTLEQALTDPSLINANGDTLLQNSIRQLTGNQSVEIVQLPTGVGLKATVASQTEAEALLNLVPVSPDRPVLPFIVIRGAGNGTNGVGSNGITTADGTPESPTYYQRAALTAEDQSTTRTLQAVTGIPSVYVTRTSNGLAIYGAVRTRIEYETVRRYAQLLAQSGGTAAGGAAGGVRANSISTGSTFPLNVQFFVRILDQAAQSVRRVNVATSVVEINRQAARKLGVEVGAASLVGGTAAGASTGTFNEGTFQVGPGIGDSNPFRARVSALYGNGLARILSQPNLSAVEGAEAQITIGGQRPVPSAAVAGGGGGGSTVGQSVEFRRFGIILTMRPTVTDDDTIILQVRADISQLDATSGITLNGSFIPGETVRSIDTTITLRDGDTLAMGGLISNERQQNTSRIPVLSQLPILGALFRSKQFQNNETELAIFMTPRIERLATTPGTVEDVKRVPSLPALPGVQQRNEIFAFSSGGSG